MPISLTCTSCNRSLRVKDELAGRQILCPDCQTKLTVPGGDVPPPLPPVESAPEEAFSLEKPAHDPLSERAGLPQRPSLEEDFDDEPMPPRRTPPKPAKEFWTTNAGVGGGLLMMLIGVVVFVVCLFMQRISIWGPIIFIIGLIAFIKGLVNRDS